MQHGPDAQRRKQTKQWSWIVYLELFIIFAPYTFLLILVTCQASNTFKEEMRIIFTFINTILLSFFKVFPKHMGVPKIGVPQNGWFFKWKTQQKWMIWGENPTILGNPPWSHFRTVTCIEVYGCCRARWWHSGRHRQGDSGNFPKTPWRFDLEDATGGNKKRGM